MKYLAYALITFGLIAGSLAAVTAYVPSLDTAASSETPLTLNAPAGIDDAGKPLVAPDASDASVLLTEPVAATLAEAGVQRVRVKEFAVGRWDLGWLFGLSLLAMLAGGLILRREDRQHMRVLLTRKTDETTTPAYALSAACQEIDGLLDALDELPPETHTDAITSRLDALQDTHLAAFVDARPELIGRYGIAGYARLMDPFAGAERALNRAWSAAADDVLPASLEALAIGKVRLEETQRRLAAQ